jgi:hypothetical protein
MSKGIDTLDRDDWITYPVRLLSLEGACKYLSCSGDLLEELIAVGDIQVIRLGRERKGGRDRRKRWIDRLDLDRLIEVRKCAINRLTKSTFQSSKEFSQNAENR